MSRYDRSPSRRASRGGFALRSSDSTDVPTRSRSGIWILIGCSALVIGAFAVVFSAPTGQQGSRPAETPQPSEKALSQLAGEALPPNAEVDSPEPRRFEICVSVKQDCVVDGDTIYMSGTMIRVADIDAPEVNNPQCEFERQLADQATFRLMELLNEGEVSALPIGDRDEDQYGRKLRVLVRDGRSLGDILVSEGLARTWTGRREPWC